MTQPDVQATLQARFVDDDTLVRTGRALLEVDGYGWVVVPVPAGWAEQVQAVLDAAVEADTISVFVDAAEAAATAASGHAQAALVEADRSSSEADRAEAAAQSAATGVQPDTVGRLHLTPALRGEIDGKAEVSHDHTASDVSDSTSTGRSVLTASSQAAARQAIGAGTSNLALGTTSSTAARGDHTHAEYATTTTVNGVSSRVTTLEDDLTTLMTEVPGTIHHLLNSQPIIVSEMDPNPLPGRIYFVTG